jgi:hypothetical protein
MEITQHARYTCTFCGKASGPLFLCCGILLIRMLVASLPMLLGQREAFGGRHLEVFGV